MGRFLRIGHQSSSKASQVVPSPYSVVADKRDEPGEEGQFLPVCGKLRETDVFTGDTRVTHNYPEESISFWNPLYRVFLRINEQGGMDCSPVINSTAKGTILPAGFGWERFTLEKPM